MFLPETPHSKPKRLTVEANPNCLFASKIKSEVNLIIVFDYFIYFDSKNNANKYLITNHFFRLLSSLNLTSKIWASSMI